MPGLEEVTFEIDPQSVVGAIGQMNSAIEGFERRGSSSNQKLQDSFERMSNLLLRMNDKAQDSNLRLVRSNEMRAASYGKELTEVQRLIAQRDEYNKRLAGSEEAIRRNSAAFGEMISKAEASESGGKFKEFGENIAQFIEQPMLAGKSAVTGFLTSMGPVGGIAAAAAGGLMAFAAAGYEAAKSVGEAGVQVRDMELRMGVTDKQAAELGFTAKASGADVAVFEGAMRGLTKAVEGTDPAAAKARAELGRMGVDVDQLKRGTAGTYDTLLKLSTGLGSMSNTWERNATGMDLFNRKWFEMAPALMHLQEYSEYFNKNGLPFQDDKFVAGAEEHLKWATEVDTRWNNIVLHAKDYLATMVEIAAKGHDIASVGPPALPEGGPAGARMLSDYGMTLNLHPPAPSSDAAFALGQAAMAGEVRQRDAMKAAYESTTEGLEELVKTERKAAEEARAAYFGAEKGATNLSMLQTTFTSAQGAVVRDQGQLDARRVAGKEAEDYLAQQITQLTAPYRLELARDAAQARSSEELGKAASEAFIKTPRSADEMFLKPLELSIKQLDQTIATEDKALKFSREADLSQQESAIRVGGILGGKSDALSTDRQLTAAKKASLDDQYRFELEEVDAVAAYITNADDRRMELRMQHAKDVGELEMKLAEEVAQKTREQFDSIKQTATSLWTTALEHPDKFGKQLQQTMHQAVMKPVAEGLGGLTAQVLQPIVYGADGKSGIAGMFKGTFGSFNKPVDPLGGALDSNAAATRQLTSAITDLSGNMGEERRLRTPGPGGSTISGGTGGFGIGGFSMSAPSAPGGYSLGVPSGGFGIPGFHIGGGTASTPGSGYPSGGWGTNIFNPSFGGVFGGDGSTGSLGYGGAPGGTSGYTSGFDGPVWQTGTTAAMPGGGGGGASRNPYASAFAGIFGKGGIFSGGGAGGGTQSAAGGGSGILGGLKGSLTGLEKSIGYSPSTGWSASPVKNTSGIDPDTGQPTFSTTGGSDSFGTVATSVGRSPAVGAAGMGLA